jgi:hypothetical protein
MVVVRIVGIAAAVIALAGCHLVFEHRPSDGGRADARPGGEAGPGPGCGDGVAAGLEACDGVDLRGQSCKSLGLLGGTLACGKDCRFDYGLCSSCGDGVLQGAETCDGANLGGKDCAGLGFGGGALACSSCQHDTRACTTPAHATLIHAGSAGAVVVRRLETSSRSWGPPVSVGGLAGAPRRIVNRISPKDPRDELAAVLTETASELRLQLLRFGERGWTLDELVILPVPLLDAGKRLFDLRYQASGKALLVYSNNTPNPQVRTYAPESGWSEARGAFTLPPGKSPVRWVTLASQPGSEQLALVYSDGDTILHAASWDGSAFVEKSKQTLDDTPPRFATPFFDAAYEQPSGKLLVAWGQQCCQNLNYRYTVANQATLELSNASVDNTWVFIRLAARPDGNVIALVGNHATVALWKNGGWAGPETRLWDPKWPTGLLGPRWADLAWLGTKDRVLLVHRGIDYEGNDRGQLRWASATSASATSTSAWQKHPPFPVAGMGELVFVELERFPAEDRVLAVFSDHAGKLWAASYSEAESWALLGGPIAQIAAPGSATASPLFSLDISI